MRNFLGCLWPQHADIRTFRLADFPHMDRCEGVWSDGMPRPLTHRPVIRVICTRHVNTERLSGENENKRKEGGLGGIKKLFVAQIYRVGVAFDRVTDLFYPRPTVFIPRFLSPPTYARVPLIGRCACVCIMRTSPQIPSSMLTAFNFQLNFI